MGEHAEVALALPGRVGAAAERRAEQALVAREGALDLPALAVLPLGEAPLHLAAVLRLRPRAAPVAAVQRDHRGADAQVLARQAVVLLAVEGRVAQDPVPADDQAGLPQGRAELGRVVTGAEGDGGRGEEVAGGVAGDRELDPGLGAELPAGPLEEIAGGVAALQPGGVDGRLGLVPDQAALPCARGGLEEEQDEVPFFSSRRSA